MKAYWLSEQRRGSKWRRSDFWLLRSYAGYAGDISFKCGSQWDSRPSDCKDDNMVKSLHKYVARLLRSVRQGCLPPKTPGCRLWPLLWWWREGAEPFWCWYLRGGEGRTTMVPESGLPEPEPEGRRPWLWREVSSHDSDFNLDCNWPWSLPEVPASKIGYLWKMYCRWKIFLCTILGYESLNYVISKVLR